MMTGLNRILNDKMKSLPITLAYLTLFNRTENTSNVSHFFPENITAASGLAGQSSYSSDFFILRGAKVQSPNWLKNFSCRRHSRQSRRCRGRSPLHGVPEIINCINSTNSLHQECQILIKIIFFEYFKGNFEWLPPLTHMAMVVIKFKCSLNWLNMKGQSVQY